MAKAGSYKLSNERAEGEIEGAAMWKWILRITDMVLLQTSQSFCKSFVMIFRTSSEKAVRVRSSACQKSRETCGNEVCRFSRIWLKTTKEWNTFLPEVLNHNKIYTQRYTDVQIFPQSAVSISPLRKATQLYRYSTDGG